MPLFTVAVENITPDKCSKILNTSSMPEKSRKTAWTQVFPVFYSDKNLVIPALKSNILCENR